MTVLRTPDERFTDLPDFAFEPRYVDLEYAGMAVRMHYVDEGSRDAEPVLMLHGEPSWSFLYRTMIPVFVAAGYRAVAPDLIGFGRSDKPVDRDSYTYQHHVDVMRAFLESLNLNGINLVCQDWGGLIGLRLLAENGDRFSRAVTANTGLPTGDQPAGDAFLKWQRYSQEAGEFPIGGVIERGCVRPVSAVVVAGYDAPFPDESYKAGARAFPMLVPIRPDDPAAEANRAAWASLMQWDKPFLTAFSDSDPITRGAEKYFHKAIPGARDQAHTTIENAGHFLQEDAGPELARVIVQFMRTT